MRVILRSVGTSLGRLIRPMGMTCPDPDCGGTMTPYGDRYKCQKCGGLL